MLCGRGECVAPRTTGQEQGKVTRSTNTDRTWPRRIDAITLFVEDLGAAKAFYLEVFEQPVLFEGDTSVVFDFGSAIINLLQIDSAPELIAPASVGGVEGGSRFVITVPVDDVDARCEVLAGKGVRLLNGPMDRSWGIRTASFRDPAGHIWEIAQPLAGRD
jgi:catechol 2,3-dioxygenase-like lactoylglutathione lyase family enzyme